MDNVKIHGDGLVIGDNKYKHHDLDLLPENLSIQKAKTRRDGNDIYFQSEFSPLSNFSPSRIEDDDHSVFTSGEQAFQYRKAVFANFHRTAQKIKRNDNPYEIKRLGNQVPTSDQWKNIETDVMADILLKKFCQNPDLSNLLLETGDHNLHEASNDHRWATGAELSSKAVLSGQWPCNDMLGQLLEGVRLELSHLQASTDRHSEHLSPYPNASQAHDVFSPMPDDSEVPQYSDPEQLLANNPPPPSQSTQAHRVKQPINQSLNLPPPPPSALTSTPKHANTSQSSGLPPSSPYKPKTPTFTTNTSHSSPHPGRQYPYSTSTQTPPPPPPNLT